ncbi:MAG: HAMP domain-containing sensor histidine kinase [Myxococcota bacterium]
MSKSSREDPTRAAAALAHELRQPLFALRGRLQLLHGGEGPVNDEVWSELQVQLDHIESLLDHYGQPRQDLPAAPFDVREPVGHVLRMLKSKADAAGVVMCVDAPHEPVWVEGEAIAVRQIVANLLQNAIDAVSPARVREIVVRVMLTDHEVTITIEDSGVGVPDDLRPHLFEPFVTTKPPGEGTGLGLFISQRRVAELGGQVTIEPGPTGGTRARVVLPRVTAPTARSSSSAG